MKNPKLRVLLSLVEGAIMVALAQVLGYLKLWQMPNGGSVTFVMLPIFVYCVRWGFGRGILAAFALAVLQFLLDGGLALGWTEVAADGAGGVKAASGGKAVLVVAVEEGSAVVCL